MNIFLFNIFLLALVAIQSVNPLPGQLDILTDGSGEDSPQQAVHSGSGGTSKNLELTSTPVSNKTNTGAVATDLDNPNYFEGDLNIPQEQISQAYKLQGTSNVSKVFLYKKVSKTDLACRAFIDHCIDVTTLPNNISSIIISSIIII